MNSPDIKTLLEWLQICQQNGRSFPSSLTTLMINIDHSVLLRRMLEGKPPLPKAPPRTFSYPNYQMIESGEYYPL
ncbi:MAG TPA: hypothetical protein VI423_00920, partial [Paenisporosarcina sp.]|nr:hypothetical protein [Paenisporosarcina sp.]